MEKWEKDLRDKNIKKGSQINIRLSDWEKEKISKNAKKHKKTLSRYLIEKGLKED